ncbi:MAG: hypothetical protein AAF493_04640 [Pseudomonadota bacterium]
MAALGDPDDPIFTARERAVLRFASAMSRNQAEVADGLFDEMREFFDDAQLVEIGFAVTTLHGMNQFNNFFGIEPEDEPMVSYTGMDAPVSK